LVKQVSENRNPTAFIAKYIQPTEYGTAYVNEYNKQFELHQKEK
jgi:hypothetical protein